MSKKRKHIRRLTTDMRGKLGIVFISIFCLFLVLVVRLVYWNVKDGSKFKTIVLGQQNHTSTTIPYERGKIYDRNGNILASNEKVYTLILEPKNILTNTQKPKETLAATAESLAKYFDFDEKKLRKKIKENENSYYVIYQEDDKEITFKQVESFRNFLKKAKKSTDDAKSTEEKAEIEKAKLVSGVMFEESYRRYYPYKSLACRILGFTSAGNQGNWGIEQQYNSVLNGTDGRSYYYFNESLVQEQTVKEAVNGQSVVSTIDMQIQKVIEKRLKKFDEKVGSKATNILVMDPNSGEILAMAGSNPYDLNDPLNEDNLKMLYTDEEIAAMKAYTEKKEKEEAEKAKEATTEEEESEESDEKDQKEDKVDKDAVPDERTKAEKKKEKEEKEKQKTIYEGFYELWRNSIISDTKEPGSTFKPFTVAAGLENGTLNGKEEYSCDGGKSVGKRRIGCSHVHGTLSLKDAVAKSCNVAMMNIVYKEGAKKFYAYQNLFGFGRKTGIDLPGEADTRYLVYNADNYQNDITLCTNSFGQNFNCSMIQLAAGFASLINGGYYYKPYIVKQIQTEKGEVVEDVEKTVLRNTVSEETSRTLRNYLEETVESGTGVIGQIPGYSLGGKTGTAEKIPRDKEHYYISFIGFAPVDNPQVLVYVTIDEPNVENQATAGPAVDLERKCMEEILPLMGIEQTEKITTSDLERYELYTGHAWKGVKQPGAQNDSEEDSKDKKNTQNEGDNSGEQGNGQAEGDDAQGQDNGQTEGDDAQGQDNGQAEGDDAQGQDNGQTEGDDAQGQDNGQAEGEDAQGQEDGQAEGDDAQGQDNGQTGGENSEGQ